MTEPSTVPSAVTEPWRPLWASVLAAAVSVWLAVVTLFGAYMFFQDLSQTGEWLDGLGIAVGAGVMPVALTGLVASAFYFTRGGTIPWAITLTIGGLFAGLYGWMGL